MDRVHRLRAEDVDMDCCEENPSNKSIILLGLFDPVGLNIIEKYQQTINRLTTFFNFGY